MEDGAIDDRLFATFEKHDEFVACQSKFLELCNKSLASEEQTEAELLLKRLALIVSLQFIFAVESGIETRGLQLNEYQEQAYLLDPFLERLVSPVVEQFKLSVSNISSSKNNQGSQNIARVAFLLYCYVTIRGHKTISP